MQEVGNLTNVILFENAKHIGYNISHPRYAHKGWEANGTDFLLHRHQFLGDVKYPQSIPMVCGYDLGPYPFSARNTTPPRGPCLYSSISKDRMQWCVNTLGARYTAIVA